MQFRHRAFHLLKYLVRAKTKYYLHSPFIYQFYLNVLEGEVNATEINFLRKQLAERTDEITFNDLGDGGKRKSKSISRMVDQSSVTERYGRVLFRAARYFQPKFVLEFGTNLGLSTAYLAKGNPNAQIFTIEGSAQIQNIARENLKSLPVNQVNFFNGSFEEKLPEVLQLVPQLDLVFMDGNHRHEPTINYFKTILEKSHENTVLILDDIYWSREMTAAWETIKAHEKVTLTVDIYRMGFVFFNRQKLAKEHFRLLY